MQGRHEAPDQPSHGSKERLVVDLPARESLELNRVIYEIPKPDFEQIVGELTEMLDVRSSWT